MKVQKKKNDLCNLFTFFNKNLTFLYRLPMLSCTTPFRVWEKERKGINKRKNNSCFKMFYLNETTRWNRTVTVVWEKKHYKVSQKEFILK